MKQPPTARQFTSLDFTTVLKSAGVRLLEGLLERVDAEARLQGVRLGLQAVFQRPEARAGIGWSMDLYNSRRPHSSLDGEQTPGDAYTHETAAQRLGLRPASSQPEKEAA